MSRWRMIHENVVTVLKIERNHDLYIQPLCDEMLARLLNLYVANINFATRQKGKWDFFAQFCT
jgi:hypothetical protein